MIHTGDFVQWCNEYDGELFHAMFTDAPYHLTAPGDIQKGKTSKGFMGQDWDGGDIAFQPEAWAAARRVLHPGAFCFAFAGTRGYHRMATAIEDAGFIIHPMIIWANKQGFPKATRVDTQIDRAAGVEQEKVGQKRHQPKFAAAEFGYREKDNGFNSHERSTYDITKPVTDKAKIWAGHRYGLQAIRPMLEPICVFQNPFKRGDKPFESIVKTGAGTYNIDGAWIETGAAYARNNTVGQNGAFNASGGEVSSEGGHWPANMVIDEYYAGDLDQDTAEQFYVAGYQYEQLEDSDPIIFAAKASMAEKEAGLDAMQRRIMVGEDDFEDGTINDGREAVSDRPYLRNQTQRRNIHATVKPIALTRWLATLLLPPKDYSGRLFVPFSGVASEMIGAMLAGWDFIQGVELVPEHVKIAEVRLEYWKNWRGMPDLKPKITYRSKKKNEKVDEDAPNQSTLF